MDATEVLAQAVELVKAGREQDVDGLMVHAVHAGVRPSDLMVVAIERGRSEERERGRSEERPER